MKTEYITPAEFVLTGREPGFENLLFPYALVGFSTDLVKTIQDRMLDSDASIDLDIFYDVQTRAFYDAWESISRHLERFGVRLAHAEASKGGIAIQLEFASEIARNASRRDTWNTDLGCELDDLKNNVVSKKIFLTIVKMLEVGDVPRKTYEETFWANIADAII